MKHEIYNKERKLIEKDLTPGKAIRCYCLECSNFSVEGIRNCPIKNCPLYPFRFGKNPNIKRVMTEEQKKEAVERLKKARDKTQK